MAGQDFPLTDDAKILGINSPKDHVRGPYIVVYKNLEKRWAIVALDYDEEPRLGIRWFTGGGIPLSSSYPIWFIVPTSLSRNMLFSLPLNHKLSQKLDDFLAGKIQGTELQHTARIGSS